MSWWWWWAWGFAEEDIAKQLPVKKRRKIGIILLSGGVFLCIIGLAPMYLFQDPGGLGGIGLLGLFVTLFPIGIFLSYLSIPFLRKFEESGWLEDALFEWSFWFGDRDITEAEENMKQQIDCSSCNQKLNIPFSYSGKISCPACGINIELEEGIIQAEGEPSIHS
tara:strand:- start:97 stop:591 length:495 start_codon:yes stop_codon:yes gene_type:complete